MANEPDKIINLLDYMTTSEAATVLGLEYKTFMARIYNDKIDALKFGRTVLVKKSDVENMKKEGARASRRTLEKASR